MTERIQASDLRAGDVINLGGRAHVDAIKRSGALVTALIPEMGAWLTFDASHPITLLSRPTPKEARRSARRRGAAVAVEKVARVAL